MNIRYYWYQTISCSSFDSLGAVMIAMFSNDCPYYLSVFCKIHLSVFFCICRIVCNLNRRFGSSQIRWTEWFTCWSVVNWSRCLLWLIYLGCLCVCVCYSIIVSVAVVVVVVTALSLKPAKLGKKKMFYYACDRGFSTCCIFIPLVYWWDTQNCCLVCRTLAPKLDYKPNSGNV